MTLPLFPSKREQLSETFTSWDYLPCKCDSRRGCIHPHGQMSWYTVRIFEAEAEKGPFQKHRPLLPFIPPSSQLFLQQHKSLEFWEQARCVGRVCADSKILGGENSRERKQFSSFPWFLSISVHLHHVCAWYAKLFSIWGSKTVL